MFFNGSKRKICKRINSRKEKIPGNRVCSECEYCEFGTGTRIKDCICICMRNSKYPVNMGNILHAKHEYRNKNKEEQYKKRGRR